MVSLYVLCSTRSLDYCPTCKTHKCVRMCTCVRGCGCVFVHVVYKLLRYVMTNIHQLKRNCRINGANFDVQNGFTTQLRVCDWFAFDGSWLMSKYNFVYVHNMLCTHRTLFKPPYWHTCSTLIPFNFTFHSASHRFFQIFFCVISFHCSTYFSLPSLIILVGGLFTTFRGPSLALSLF